MHGALALSAGVLFVGRSAKTATVQAFDLDGRPLETCLEFRDTARGRSGIAGLDVDADRRIWVADDAAAKLRGFTLFGRPVVELGGAEEDLVDARGALGVPVAVRTQGSDDELVLLVASGGRRRYALRLLRPFDARAHALRSLGEPEGVFDDLSDAHWTTLGDASDAGRADRAGGEDDVIVCCERRAARLQVFRGGRFHFALPVRGRPEAVVRLADGRFVVALGAGAEDHPAERRGSLVLLGPDGRHLRTLAGSDEVDHPSSLAALAGDGDAETRLWVLDREGARVQLFTLDGRGWGAFASVAAL